MNKERYVKSALCPFLRLIEPKIKDVRYVKWADGQEFVFVETYDNRKICTNIAECDSLLRITANIVEEIIQML